MAFTLNIQNRTDAELGAALGQLNPNGAVAEAIRQELDGRDERRAELATERFFEDRGYWEARGQEDHEARMGVVDFRTAMEDNEADAEALTDYDRWLYRQL